MIPLSHFNDTPIRPMTVTCKHPTWYSYTNTSMAYIIRGICLTLKNTHTRNEVRSPNPKLFLTETHHINELPTQPKQTPLATSDPIYRHGTAIDQYKVKKTSAVSTPSPKVLLTVSYTYMNPSIPSFQTNMHPLNFPTPVTILIQEHKTPSLSNKLSKTLDQTSLTPLVYTSQETDTPYQENKFSEYPENHHPFSTRFQLPSSRELMFKKVKS